MYIPKPITAKVEQGSVTSQGQRTYRRRAARHALGRQAVELKAAITLAHLVAMTSGLACDDEDDASPGNEDRMKQPHDGHRDMLALPMVRARRARRGLLGGLNLLGKPLAQTRRLGPGRASRPLALVAGAEHGELAGAHPGRIARPAPV